MTNGKRIPRGTGVLAVTGAIILGAAPSSLANGDLPVLASGDASRDSYGDSTIDVNHVQQAQDGRYTSVALTVNNTSGSDYFFNDANFDGYGFDTFGMSGITVTGEDETLYYPLQDGRQKCLCAGDTAPEDFVRTLSSDDSNTYWASYLLPKDVTTINVEVPGFDPVEVDIE